MTDRFSTIPLVRLLKIFLTETNSKNEFLGILESQFVKRYPSKFHTKIFNQTLEFPLGVAAGPHSQLAQNIVTAWLCGARYIELKTVQTLDDLTIQKPCIDMQDEGYNCEWSQELKIKESFDQYLDAWIMVHILNHKFGNDCLTGTIFNMSIGYNMQGILNENVQWFLDKMVDCSVEKKQKIDQIRSLYPMIDSISIPDTISNNITLSTMHGCPSDEIETIAAYLIEKRKLHTFVKLNPTLLGKEAIHELLNSQGNFDTYVPDEAFAHDLKYNDAIILINQLKKKADDAGVQFGLKLTNTLECLNHKNTFADTQSMYMSGRALHPISVLVANKLQTHFAGELSLSFAGGADAFNFPDLLACGLSPITVSSDILRPGGYARLGQYVKELAAAWDSLNAQSMEDFMVKKAGVKNKITNAALINLEKYSNSVVKNHRYQNTAFKQPNIKGNRKLDYFDCIEAPCVENCATHQHIPKYLEQASAGLWKDALQTILLTNPFPMVTGNICDHLCQDRCTRINYDTPIPIREVKRTITETVGNNLSVNVLRKSKCKVAIIGAGPSGLSCAYYLSKVGVGVEVFEAQDKAGGMVSHAIPEFRLNDNEIDTDINAILKQVVNIFYNKQVDKAFFNKLYADYDYLYLAVGAWGSKSLDIKNIESEGVINALDFLLNARLNSINLAGKKVVIVGGGNSAMDAARVAHRLVGEKGTVTLMYRRTIKEMPADSGEIKAVIKEGIQIIENAVPQKVITKNGAVGSIVFNKGTWVKDATAKHNIFKPNVAGDNELECDILIPAIGQQTQLSFINPELFKAHPNTGEIKLKRVFTGGDALRGPATAIKAVADGRQVAETILAREHIEQRIKSTKADFSGYEELMQNRGTRYLNEPTEDLGGNGTISFKAKQPAFSLEHAAFEASRCLKCDQMCNICITVCPNRANYGYTIKPLKYNMLKVVKSEGELVFSKDKPFIVNQQYQIINIADFCNECGNCNTFCPTNSAPYKNKPRFYLTIQSFNAASEGYFLSKMPNKIVLIAKEPGGIRTIEKTMHHWIYETDHVKVLFNIEDFNPLKVDFKVPCAKQMHFQTAAEMSVLYDAAATLY